eukprot:TRINITY_DN25152_c0_g2_i3.p1 TRINITY_DN25152_c0_g2~~TRINITY_DN25152_c0_g2_i3.p1  ORF type:complete len:229 (+),score=27.25 TRINITY_DN25152_c0_g2_i3:45-731(+)
MAPMIWSAAGSGHRPLEATLGSRGGPHDAVASSNSAKCVSADLYGRDFDYMDGVPLVLCTLRTPEALFTPAEWRTLREAATLRDSSAPGRMLGKACSVPDFWPVDSRSRLPSVQRQTTSRSRTGGAHVRVIRPLRSRERPRNLRRNVFVEDFDDRPPSRHRLLNSDFGSWSGQSKTPASYSWQPERQLQRSSSSTIGNFYNMATAAPPLRLLPSSGHSHRSSMSQTTR